MVPRVPRRPRPSGAWPRRAIASHVRAAAGAPFLAVRARGVEHRACTRVRACRACASARAR
eukprot:7099032-Pyramimonas_sp.AAC.1